MGCPGFGRLFLIKIDYMSKRIAIQGFSGCFHEEAAHLFYKDEELSMVECATFDQLYSETDGGNADAMVMAIENTISGGLLPNFELLRNHPQRIKGEVYLRIVQNLMALPGQKIEDIREVRSHYMAINQTREFFKAYPSIRLVESEDTAKSAAQVAREQLRGVAAIASACAADIYGLEILQPSIETYKQNYTRFLILDVGLTVGEADIDKASLCFTLPHKSGALSSVLTIFSFYDMNLTRIQSLPIPGREWQYFFYVDIKFASYERYKQAMSAARPLMEDIQILGEYKSAI